mmetsp:Transcript_33531/g.85803  ORF Transcript_33531/g.85803 Transcript_33531/m.85803 type:complete len:232 (+) Transcript_33531:359-1054(+)
MVAPLIWRMGALYALHTTLLFSAPAFSFLSLHSLPDRLPTTPHSSILSLLFCLLSSPLLFLPLFALNGRELLDDAGEVLLSKAIERGDDGNGLFHMLREEVAKGTNLEGAQAFVAVLACPKLTERVFRLRDRRLLVYLLIASEFCEFFAVFQCFCQHQRYLLALRLPSSGVRVEVLPRLVDSEHLRIFEILSKLQSAGILFLLLVRHALAAPFHCAVMEPMWWVRSKQMAV